MEIDPRTGTSPNPLYKVVSSCISVLTIERSGAGDVRLMPSKQSTYAMSLSVFSCGIRHAEETARLHVVFEICATRRSRQLGSTGWEEVVP